MKPKREIFYRKTNNAHYLQGLTGVFVINAQIKAETNNMVKRQTLWIKPDIHVPEIVQSLTISDFSLFERL